MKLLIASDIHGSAKCCAALMERISEEKPDKVILLGDLLYHGPRNDLPGEYDTKKVVEMLNSLSPAPLCVRGNCDSEVAQMVLHFPMRASSGTLMLENGTSVYLTHGHLLDSILAVASMEKEKTCVLFGHTHVPECTEDGNVVLMNPGSVSIPKAGSTYSFMTYENGIFEWKGVFDGLMYRRYEL